MVGFLHGLHWAQLFRQVRPDGWQRNIAAMYMVFITQEHPCGIALLMFHNPIVNPECGSKLVVGRRSLPRSVLSLDLALINQTVTFALQLSVAMQTKLLLAAQGLSQVKVVR